MKNSPAIFRRVVRELYSGLVKAELKNTLSFFRLVGSEVHWISSGKNVLKYGSCDVQNICKVSALLALWINLMDLRTSVCK